MEPGRIRGTYSFLLCQAHRLLISREPGFSISILNILHCNCVFTYVSHPRDYELLEGRGITITTTILGLAE